MNSQFALMRDIRFWPLFVTQALGAFNDNLFKTTLSVMVAYGVIETGAAKPEILVSLAAALFIFPFILFTPLAGVMADKFDKDKIIRIIKMVEICIALVAVCALWTESVYLLLFVLFAFGTHSAFFSPCKFSILPQHLNRDELIGGNALVNTGSYLAILGGTIIGGLLALSGLGVAFAAVLMVLTAGAGYTASRFIPRAAAPVPTLTLSFNPLAEAVRAIKYARSQPAGVFAAMMGSAWFYFTGATLLGQFPNYTKQALGVDNMVLTLFMTVFSLGVGFGGLLNNRLLKSKVEATFTPVAALVLAIFLLDLYFASGAYDDLPVIINAYDLTGIGAFLSYASGWRIMFDLLSISVAGGIFVVPLKSVIQDRTPLEHRARVMAASSLLDALFILSSSVAAMALFALGFRVQELFVGVAAGSAFMAWYLSHTVADNFLRQIWRRIHG